MPRSATDKRDRLVNAAADLFHRTGFANTALVDIAGAAGVSPGSLFYFFKSKDDLARAVIDARCRALADELASIEASNVDPWARIDGFVELAQKFSGTYVSVGCPLARLVRDLAQETTLRTEVARLYGVQLDWLVRQFELVSLSLTKAKESARFVLAGYHGAAFLAFALSDAAAIDTEVAKLRTWLAQEQVAQNTAV